MCAHPYAAWRTHSTTGRLVVFFGYFGASYALVLVVMQFLSF